MNLHRFLGARFVSEACYVLGGAVAWGFAGLGIGLVVAWKSGDPTSLVWVTSVSRGFAFAWWGGLIWCTLLALTARRGTRSPAPIATLTRATWIAATITAVAAAAALMLERSLVAGIGIGVALATVLARTLVARS